MPEEVGSNPSQSEFSFKHLFVNVTIWGCIGSVVSHTRKSSSIYKHYNLQHNSEMPERFIEQFHIIAKCSGKFDCLVKEMLYIRMRKPTLNVQTDSIRAKVFV